MWANGDDVNDAGDRVRLYQPITYTSGRRLDLDDPTTSYIGGGPSSYFPSSFCAQCQEPLDRLVQLHVPKTNVTYQVLGCNRAACGNAVFANKNNINNNSAKDQPKKKQLQQNATNHQFSMGGGGVFVCWRVDPQVVANSTPAAAGDITTSSDREPAPAHVNTWDAQDDITQPDDNDWAVDSDGEGEDKGGNGNSLDDLEAKVAEMELKQQADGETKNRTAFKSQQHTAKQAPNTYSTGLPAMELHSILEPPNQKTKYGLTMGDDHDDDDDDDDVGMQGTDDKIQQMLARYMAEEEDQDILAAIRGAGKGGGGGGGKSKEKDERLKAADRALLAFTDRMKRSTRQVLRYATGGQPLWSVPRPQAPSRKDRNSKVAFEQPPSDSNTAQQPFVIPKCTCGADRRFEFQLMPSLLHILDVDKHATAANKNSADSDNNTASIDAIMSQDYGGMNWGVLAVYVCPNPTPQCSKSEFVVVQASVDEAPCKRHVAPVDAPVFIAEDQTFDDDEDDVMDGDEGDDNESQCLDGADLVFTPVV